MSPDLKPVWNTIGAQGGNVYCYGESLRLLLKKQAPTKYTLKVIKLTLEQVVKILEEFEFQYTVVNNTVVITHNNIEYLLYFYVDVQTAITFNDFSINLIHLDCVTDQVLDPYGGVTDIKNKIVRIEKQPILADPLKLIQAARLAAELEFTAPLNTWYLLYEHAPLIKHVNPYLLKAELDLILLSERPSIAFKLMQNTRLLDYILPELSTCITIVQSKRSGVHNVFDHTMYALDAAERNLVIRMTILFHDIAKPQTIEYSDDGKIHFFKHDIVGAKIAKTYLKLWNYEKEFINKVSTLITHHMFDAAPNITDKAVRRLIKKVGKEHIYDLLLVREADRSGSPEKISMKKIKSIRKKIDKEIGNV